MARKLLDKLPDHHDLDVHFLHASRAWRQNKKEVFGEAGSSGSFEYVEDIHLSFYFIVDMSE